MGFWNQLSTFTQPATPVFAVAVQVGGYVSYWGGRRGFTSDLSESVGYLSHRDARQAAQRVAQQLWAEGLSGTVDVIPKRVFI